jgi:hypothetical protein
VNVKGVDMDLEYLGLFFRGGVILSKANHYCPIKIKNKPIKLLFS